ncbi:hypothetical protein [Rodentibacter genomosp. 1]|nr:hypothetical protein [Rodentibacter genomosp. 1]
MASIMAFISVKTTALMTAESETALKKQIGQAMSLIGQSEAYLMLILEGNQSLYLRGEKKPAALINANIFGNPQHFGYTDFAQRLTQIMNDILNIPPQNSYIQFNNIKVGRSQEI